MNSRSWSFYILYVVTSISFATLILYLAISPLSSWKQALMTSRPWRGDMGFGRFTIRGSRRVNDGSTITPFAYAWRRTDPTQWTRLSAWLGYFVHQLGQWYIITCALQQRTTLQYSSSYRWWNWAMVYLNVTMAIYKLIQSHLFYDGLAIDVSEAFTQGTVIMILVVALILAIPRRGIVFGYPKTPIGSIAYHCVWQFIKKYHAYILSFGTVFNFHYHPAEGTLSHYHGFIYQCLLLWQSTNFLHTSHRNRYWTLFLEIWVLIHGSITAYFQPGTGWQIFFYGFLAVFITNQIYDTGILDRRQPFGSWRTLVVYLLFIIVVVVGFGMDDRRYYRILFIPVAEYLAVVYCLGLGLVAYGWIQRYPSHRVFVVCLMYILAGAGVIFSLAYILAGHLKVFNDY